MGNVEAYLLAIGTLGLLFVITLIWLRPHKPEHKPTP